MQVQSVIYICQYANIWYILANSGEKESSQGLITDSDKTRSLTRMIMVIVCTKALELSLIAFACSEG